MKNLRDSLTEMGNPLMDQMFSAYICRSMPKSYAPLSTVISTATSMSGKPYMSKMLIQQIYLAADIVEAMKANRHTLRVPWPPLVMARRAPSQKRARR
jgi:hypothetical protein